MGLDQAEDICPDISNPGQADDDNDGMGNACEPPVIVNEIDEIFIAAATSQELIDAVLTVNAGERVEADESITKFSAALPYLTASVTIEGGGATLRA
ncbi:MAG: hypothetical protein VCE12_16060 [Candidatus Latescibacterota bacterium]